MTARRVLAPALFAIVGVLVLPAPTPAHASCAGPAATSPHMFTGVVTKTSNRDRVATVRTDGGAVVTVVGTPEESSGATSVDRQYVAGARYEFHPINGESPYRDNACTATRLLEDPATPAHPATENTVLIAGLVLALICVSAAVTFAVRRRHRRQISV